MMGIEQLDFLEEQADTALALLAEGNTEQVTQIIQALKPLITEEKKKIAGEGNSWYVYVCTACSLACRAEFKFVPNEKMLESCWLDGKKGGKFEQKEIRVES